MLTGIMTLAICSLLATITAINPQDYVYAAMFMISTTCFLKIQWLVGTAFMVLPLILTRYWHSTSNILPTDAETHLVVSWAVGGFMAYLSDTYRRCDSVAQPADAVHPLQDGLSVGSSSPVSPVCIFGCYCLPVG